MLLMVRAGWITGSVL